MKVKFANKIYEVLYTKEVAGKTIYAIEDEPNHVDWLVNVEVINTEEKSEDEKMWKLIKKYAHYNIPDSALEADHITREHLEFWLEKQGESDETKAKVFLMNKGYPIDTNGVFPTYEEMYNIIREGLEQQSEQNHIDKVEPKFKVGDWVVFNGLTLLVNEVVQGYYRTTSIGGIRNSYDWDIDNVARLWTIEDAKEGDVLSYVTDEEDLWIMIYWSLYKPYKGHVHYHALLINNNFSDKGTCCIDIDYLKPATKEQCDLLLAKMKEAGYEWNKEKKKLIKL